MVKSGLPKFTSSWSVGRMSILYMNRAWYARAHTTRILILACNKKHLFWWDEPAKTFTSTMAKYDHTTARQSTYGIGQLAKNVLKAAHCLARANEVTSLPQGPILHIHQRHKVDPTCSDSPQPSLGSTRKSCICTRLSLSFLHAPLYVTASAAWQQLEQVLHVALAT